MTESAILGDGFAGFCGVLFIMTAETAVSGLGVPVSDLAFICSPGNFHRGPDIVKIGLFQKGPGIGDGLVVFGHKICTVAFFLQHFQIFDNAGRRLIP